MNNLFKNIEYLLLRHDCVIVPGLGAFIATRIPAGIDMETGTITAPVRTVMFNQSVMTDDGLLANSYVRKYKVSFDDARQVICRQVAFLKAFLESNNEVRVGNIGRLSLGIEDNLVFTPISTAAELAAECGYKTLKLNENAPLINSNSATRKEVEEEHDYYSFRISKTISRIAAAMLAVVAVAITVLLNPIPDDSREQRASVVPVEALMPTKATSHSETMSEPSETVTENAEMTAEEQPEEMTIPSHYLIIATFSSPAEAQAYVEKYSSVDNPMEVVASRTMSRVSIASSVDRDELRAQLNSQTVSSRYPNAWIWSRK